MLPFVVAGSVDACVVAFAAGGSEVVGVPPCAALAGGDYVVDFCGVGGAAGVLDLAGVVVSFEDLFADASPCSAVFGFSGHTGYFSLSSRGVLRLTHLPRGRCASGAFSVAVRRSAPRVRREAGRGAPECVVFVPGLVGGFLVFWVRRIV